jgi:hypothetical protein
MIKLHNKKYFFFINNDLEMNDISIFIKYNIITPILVKLFFIFIFYKNKVLMLTTSSNIFYEKLDNFLSDYINDLNVKILYTYMLIMICILLIINILLLVTYSLYEYEDLFNIELFYFCNQNIDINNIIDNTFLLDFISNLYN